MLLLPGTCQEVNGSHTRDTGVSAYYLSVDASSTTEKHALVSQAKSDGTKVQCEWAVQRALARVSTGI